MTALAAGRVAKVEARLDRLTWMVGGVLTLAGGALAGTVLLLLRAVPIGTG